MHISVAFGIRDTLHRLCRSLREAQAAIQRFEGDVLQLLPAFLFFVEVFLPSVWLLFLLFRSIMHPSLDQPEAERG